jgi:hypothetical protein
MTVPRGREEGELRRGEAFPGARLVTSSRSVLECTTTPYSGEGAGEKVVPRRTALFHSKFGKNELSKQRGRG